VLQTVKTHGALQKMEKHRGASMHSIFSKWLVSFFSMIPKEKYPPKTIISSRGNKKKFNKIREWPLYSIIRLSTMGLTGFEAYIRVHLGESLILIKPTACCLGLYITQKVSRGTLGCLALPSIIIFTNSDVTEIIFSTDSSLELSSWMNRWGRLLKELKSCDDFDIFRPVRISFWTDFIILEIVFLDDKTSKWELILKLLLLNPPQNVPLSLDFF
jgi:hypothetical protein